ncbi:MAG: DUF126 domain-containing protein [Gemmatimonadota bacterium]|nr:DUF126 domain-containing protein [Gemmatimonadota bacterium]
MAVKARVLVRGQGRGPLLRLTHPISFWGGVDPSDGRICDPRHPEFGVRISGSVLALPGTVGSSSSSAVMLELIREGTAPAAIILAHSDAILALGVVVAAELGMDGPPVVELAPAALAALQPGTISVDEDGTVREEAG